jgi:hypothetical protein
MLLPRLVLRPLLLLLLFVILLLLLVALVLLLFILMLMLMLMLVPHMVLLLLLYILLLLLLPLLVLRPQRPEASPAVRYAACACTPSYNPYNCHSSTYSTSCSSFCRCK